MPDGELFWGVLGPLTIVRAAKPVTISGPKERLVLALLFSRANAIITVDTAGRFPIALTEDGKYLYYAEGDVIRKYPLDDDELIELARSRVTRNFTAEECERYLDPDRCS